MGWMRWPGRVGIGLGLTALLVSLMFGERVRAASEVAGSPEWAMRATVIEACSCPMFCQCYFNTEPAGQHVGHEGAEHFCRFNNAYRVDAGHWGDVSLDGAKFWLAGDLGGDFSKGMMNWAVLAFDPSVTPGQRTAIRTILDHVFPVQWASFTEGPDAPIDWQAAGETAQARLGGGRTAEIALKRAPGMTQDPVTISNLKYWGAPRNTGFVLMPNDVEAYRVGDKAFEFHGTNGFMLTFDISSNDV